MVLSGSQATLTKTIYFANITPCCHIIDYGILERHSQLDATIGHLEMEIEAFERARLFSWIFFPLWIVLTIIQIVCFMLYNGRFHPLAKILDG